MMIHDDNLGHNVASKAKCFNVFVQSDHAYKFQEFTLIIRYFDLKCVPKYFTIISYLIDKYDM